MAARAAGMVGTVIAPEFPVSAIRCALDIVTFGKDTVPAAVSTVCQSFLLVLGLEGVVQEEVSASVQHILHFVSSFPSSLGLHLLMHHHPQVTITWHLANITLHLATITWHLTTITWHLATIT